MASGATGFTPGRRPDQAGIMPSTTTTHPAVEHPMAPTTRLIKAMGIIMVLMVIIPVLLAGYLFLAG